MVRAVMSEFQFEGAAAEREPAKLMSQADAENGHAPKELANAFDRVKNRLGIAGTIREENPVRLQRQDIAGRSLRGHHRDIASVIDQQAQNVLLDAVIVGDNPIALFIVLEICRGRDAALAISAALSIC